MAKKQKQPLYRMTFDGVENTEYTFKVNSVGRGLGPNGFFLRGDHSPGVLLHTELEMFKALADTGKLVLTVNRDEPEQTFLEITDKDGQDRGRIELMSYFTIRTESKLLELEERGPSKTWILTHTTNFFPHPSSRFNSIIIERIE